MAITAFTSTAIIDATTIGTTVLTASTEGIAAEAIGLGATDDVTFNSIDSVDGDFSGDITIGGAIKKTLTLFTEINGSIITGHTNFNFQIYKDLLPSTTAQKLNGSTTRRWLNTCSVDGSFSGNLNVEDGGAFQFYGLGSEGDTDTEFLRFDTVGSDFELATSSTGSGTAGSLYISAAGSSNVMFRSDHTRIFQYLRPQTTNTVDIGTDALRFRKSYFVDGDFSGDVTMSGLPTADPLVAGQLYTTTGGALKVSAG